ncbi:hypothetical protein MIND_01208800 [Mycena indigotica]|uniref:F-box domain-containing protein n=1 Tax=Mycena indigotica TaxID=2126181 RepID=A0A8H6VYS8_9AGAR|nr:uncharacterized protein MIND_01208800 [Mycena indigotica]KAF7293094.1 hypothetical protein MIND_01208800 [Mycena indigotica]
MVSSPSSTRSPCIGSSLPQELVDIIVEDIGSDDRPSLKACSLISRSFCAPAQKLLFQSFRLLPSLYRSLSLATLDELQARSPHISNHVRRLTIHCTSSRLGEGAPWMAEEQLSRVLPRFKHLTTLIVDSRPGIGGNEDWIRLRFPLSWWLLSSPTQTALSRAIAQPQLTSLTIRGVTFWSGLDLWTAVCLPGVARTQLQHLSLSEVDVQELWSGLGTEYLSPNKLRLQSLALKSDHARFMRLVPGIVDISVLQHIKLHIQNMSCEKMVQAAFLRDMRCLERLTIVLDDSLYSNSCELVISDLAVLRTLDIHFQLSYHPSRWIFSVVSQASLTHPGCTSPLTQLILEISVTLADIQYPEDTGSLVSTLRYLVPPLRLGADTGFTPLLTIRVAPDNVHFTFEEISSVKADVLEVVGNLGLHTEVEVVDYWNVQGMAPIREPREGGESQPGGC